ncbi:hypothetical protein ALI22I_30770 [Saccharothrix sp. ALI-22-I]|uniref:hypothetical protein n=1 Tax=Saccharothrix sp. ALI-22-I TaxID=1933778 RepID=UPI00097BD652|nr:hypothetical protein [Saccharothrix sp. ALI-22-I]ONI84863.1 hypothetical protein ALI22I_30770 [Saccharothrix sp. ALI-22-I]
MELAVELGEGFADDEVTVLVDGQEEWHRTGVTTNYSVGIADVARISGEPGALVEVRVRDLAGRREVGEDARLRADIDVSGKKLALGAASQGDIF